MFGPVLARSLSGCCAAVRRPRLSCSPRSRPFPLDLLSLCLLSSLCSDPSLHLFSLSILARPAPASIVRFRPSVLLAFRSSYSFDRSCSTCPCSARPSLDLFSLVRPPLSPSPPRHHSPIVGATLSAASHAAFAIAITIFQPRRRTQFPIAAVAPMHWLRPSILLCLFSGARTHCTTISLNFGRWAFALLALARRLCHRHLFHRRYYSSAPASPSPPPTSLPHRRRHHHYSCCPSAT